MGTSIIFAQIICLVYLAVGLGILINGDYYRKMMSDFVNNTAAIYIGGFMALILGYIIVVSHNIWEWHLVVIITIIGWLAIIKGILLFVFPRVMIRFSEFLIAKKNYLRVTAIFAIILGLVMGYYGFVRFWI